MGMRVVIGFLALALSCRQGLTADVKPDLVVLVFGWGVDTRPIVAPGQPFSFGITLDNSNAVVAHQIRLTAVLPKAFNFQTSDPPPTRVENGNHLVWEIDSAEPQTLPRFFKVTTETEATLVPGSEVEISAQAECSEGNANSTHSRASETIYVQPAEPRLIVSSSTLNSVLLTAEERVSFRIDIENSGTLPAIDARVEATLPTGLKLNKADPKPSSSGGQAVTFKLGNLAPNESKSVSIELAFDSLKLSDLLEKDSLLTFAFRGSRSASNLFTGQMTGFAAGVAAEVTDSRLQITKHIESSGQDVAVWLMTEGAEVPGEVSPNTDATCVIKFANLGNEPAHKVVVALYLGSGLAIAHSKPQPTRTGTDDAFQAGMSVGLAAGLSQPTGTGSNNAFRGGVARWNVGDLGVGMSRTVRSVIRATSIPDDGALVTATITADGIDLDSSNNTASLLWHNPPPQGTFKSSRHSPAVVKPIGVFEKPSAQPVRHRWRYFFALILLIVAVLIFLRARRKS